MKIEIENIIPPKLPSKLAKHIYKEIDGLKRLLAKTSGINEELLGQSPHPKTNVQNADETILNSQCIHVQDIIK